MTARFSEETMKEAKWKESLANLFEDLRILEECKTETPENFEHFCEFIAEPSFESLSKELRKYGVKSKFQTKKRKSIALVVRFPKSKIDNFHYIINLPKNSVELRLKLRIRGRRDKKAPLEEKEKFFMEYVSPSEVLKLSKEELTLDVIRHYREFNFNALNKPG